MRLHTIVTWDSENKFEDSKLTKIIISFENGVSERFQGELNDPRYVTQYLKYIFLAASNEKIHKFPSPYTEAKGKREYNISIDSQTDIHQLRDCALRIQTKHFLVTKNQWVTDPEYCAFYGSSLHIWDHDDKTYPQGDFVESLRQTVYDMDHVDELICRLAGCPPGAIYMWTNVPYTHSLQKLMKKDVEFAEFTRRNLLPIISDLNFSQVDENPTKGNLEILKGKFSAIADLADEYKKNHGIERI